MQPQTKILDGVYWCMADILHRQLKLGGGDDGWKTSQAHSDPFYRKNRYFYEEPSEIKREIPGQLAMRKEPGVPLDKYRQLLETKHHVDANEHVVHESGGITNQQGQHESDRLPKATQPSQGRFFGNETGSMTAVDPSLVNRQLRAARAGAIAFDRPNSRSRRNPLSFSEPSSNLEDADFHDAKRAVAQTLYTSTVPYNDLRKAAEGGLSTVRDTSTVPGRTGVFNPMDHSMGLTTADNAIHSSVHELGHALHYQTGYNPNKDHIDNVMGLTPYVRDRGASPVLEGVADGYSDMYRHNVSRVGVRGAQTFEPVSSTNNFDVERGGGPNNSGYPVHFELPQSGSDMITHGEGLNYAAARTITRSDRQIPSFNAGFDVVNDTKLSAHPALSGPQFTYVNRVDKDRSQTSLFS